MNIKSIVSTTVLAFASFAIAQLVDCNVNGVTVATVDFATGFCPFPIPPALPVSNTYASDEDYDIEFYYTLIAAVKYFTDIRSAGRIISIPASAVYGLSSLALFQVDSVVTPGSNSSAAIQKRFHLQGRATIPDELITKLEALNGTPVTGGIKISVVDSAVSSSFVSGLVSTGSSTGKGSGVTTSTPTSTVVVTDLKTLHLTTTVCSDHKCSLSTKPVGEIVTTVTVSGVETVYTTYCPLTESLYTSPVSTVKKVSGTSTSTSTVYITKTTLVPSLPPKSEVVSTATAATGTKSVIASAVKSVGAPKATTAEITPVTTAATPATKLVASLATLAAKSGFTYLSPASTVTIPTSAAKPSTAKPSTAPSVIQNGSANKLQQFNNILLVIPMFALL